MAAEAPARAAAEAAGGTNSLACLSVRSGFDLVLQALALPPGSEIIISAITIPAMAQIIEHHGLTPVPVDIDRASLAPTPMLVTQAITARTRAVLVAQLFGCRADLSDLAALCASRGILLLEDCAQAFEGAYGGHPGADVRMFSFGPIKTATAMGGALLSFRKPALRAQVAALQTTYPQQATWMYIKRLLLFALLKLLAQPMLFGRFVAGCRFCNVDHDRLISRLLRSSRKGSLAQRLRQRPNPALLTLLARRLGQDHRERIAQRIARAQRIIAALPSGAVPGAKAPDHSHWVLPICCVDPEALVQELWATGIDASRTASSMTVVATAGQTPVATQIMASILYVPLHPALNEAMIRQIAQHIDRKLHTIVH